MDNMGPKPRLHLFGFLDETGLLHNPIDRVFGLGFICTPNTKELHRAIITLKNKRRFHKEFKFSDISKQNLPIYVELIDIFFACTNARFHSLVIDKASLSVTELKKSHQKAYNKFAAELISNAIDKGNSRQSEYITVLADDVSTRKDDKFEKTVRERIRKDHRRNALFGIARFESHAVSEIQLVDVLLGLVAYSFKIKYGIINGSGAKLRLLKHLQLSLKVDIMAKTQVIQLRKGDRFEVVEK